MGKANVVFYLFFYISLFELIWSCVSHWGAFNWLLGQSEQRSRSAAPPRITAQLHFSISGGRIQTLNVYSPTGEAQCLIQTYNRQKKSPIKRPRAGVHAPVKASNGLTHIAQPYICTTTPCFSSLITLKCKVLLHIYIRKCGFSLFQWIKHHSLEIRPPPLYKIQHNRSQKKHFCFFSF